MNSPLTIILLFFGAAVGADMITYICAYPAWSNKDRSHPAELKTAPSPYGGSSARMLEQTYFGFIVSKGYKSHAKTKKAIPEEFQALARVQY